MLPTKYVKAATYALLILFVFTFCKQKTTAIATNETGQKDPRFRTETLLNNYEVIWGMDFLPDGDLLFTEKKVNCIVTVPVK